MEHFEKIAADGQASIHGPSQDSHRYRGSARNLSSEAAKDDKGSWRAFDLHRWNNVHISKSSYERDPRKVCLARGSGPDCGTTVTLRKAELQGLYSQDGLD